LPLRLLSKHPIATLTAGIAATFLSFALFAVLGWSAYKTLTEAGRFRSSFVGAVDAVHYLDGALTDSAELAVHTGDSRFAARYRRLRVALHSRIDELQRLASDSEERKLATQLDAANRVLDGFEDSAMSALGPDRLNAVRLLDGREYQAAKAAYTTALDGLTRRIENRLDLNERTRLRHWLSVLWAAVLTMLLLAAGWIAVISRARLEMRERRNSRRQLAESEAEHRSLIQGLPYGLLQVTKGGVIRTANPAMAKLLGFTSESELAGREFRQIVTSEEDWPRLIELERNGQLNRSEFACKRTDGSQLLILFTGRLTPMLHNEAGYELVAEDVTERKRLENELHQAQKLEAVGRLAGGVAHDFNNLLTIIIGYGEVLRSSLPAGDEPKRASLDEILNAARRAAELTAQILAFGRREIVQPQVFDLNAPIRSAEGMLHRLLGEHIQVDCEFSGELLCVRADPGRIQQVLLNLAANARDAMPHGGTITFATARVVVDREAGARLNLPPGAYARLSVSDTGEGMSQEVLARAFEPFFTTKSAGKGTGLGLSTAYGIVGQAGGQMEVESQVGRGTTFRIYLPAVEEACQGEPDSAPVAHWPTGQATILLAEDEQPVRKLAQSILERAGYTVLAAVDGEAGVKTSASHPGIIDLVITDILMPKMNGQELAERVARTRSNVRFIFLSGYADDEVVRSAMKFGQSTFLQKPFTPQQLLDAVHEMLHAG
jgi:two-component system, cell cycle sensor histidine kinase and response regulator CckA